MKGLTTWLVALASLTVVLAGIILLAAKWRWIRNETWGRWREDRLWRIADREAKQRREAALAAPPAVVKAVTEPPPFVVYEMADGSMIGDEFSFVTGLEWFDDRDREERLMKRTYALVSEELVILPDPNPIEEDDDEEPVVPGPPDTPAT